MTVFERFWSKVLKTDSCWEWQAGKDKDGYGIFWLKGKSIKAHRFVIEKWLKKSLGEGLVCHSCDNTSCVRPSHLFVGTNADNSLDSVIKGRQAKGEKCHTAVVNAAQVLEIRSLNGKLTHKRIGQRYGLSRPQVSNIIRGDTWKHLYAAARPAVLR